MSVELYNERAAANNQVLRTKSLRLLYPHQLQLVNELLAQRTIPTTRLINSNYTYNYYETINGSVSFLTAMTGCGKTSVLIEYLSKIAQRTLIVVPSIILAKWQAELDDAGIQYECLGTLTPSDELIARLKLAHVVVASANSIKIRLNIGIFDTLIIDEIDNSTCTNIRRHVEHAMHTVLVSATVTQRMLMKSCRWLPRVCSNPGGILQIGANIELSFGARNDVILRYVQLALQSVGEWITEADLQRLDLCDKDSFARTTDLIKLRITDKIKYFKNALDALLVDPLHDRYRKRDLEESIHSANTALERFETNLKENSCGICLEQMTENRLAMQCCQQMCCASCIVSLQKCCPFCRGELESTFKFYTSLVGATEPRHNLLEVLDELITKLDGEPNRKVLIFLNHFSFSWNRANNMHNLRLVRGNRNITSAIFAKFKQNNDELKFCVFYDTHSFAGTDLENATDVIICGKMATNLEQQAVGRALRLGRTAGPLTVYRLLPYE